MNVRDDSGQGTGFGPGIFRRGLLHCWRALGGELGGGGSETNWRLLFFELFVVFSLSATFYFLIDSFSVGSPNNYTNGWVFSACSIPGYHLDQLGDVWKGRLSGLFLSGYLFDSLLTDYTFQIEDFFRLFGLYQCVWLFLLFLTIILGLRRSLFINLGIFAGLMYNFSPASGLYFYPWDLPATVFFTLAVLFFARRQMWLMAAATCVGSFFKETVLVCALLALFADHWRWNKRILAFAGMVMVYVAGKKLLLSQLHFQVAAFSMNNAASLGGLLHSHIFLENFRNLFSLSFNHAVFANAGTLAAVLALGWQRRFLPYMVVIIVYLAGQFMYGAFNEFRIFMQILPLSLMLLSERWEAYAGAGASDKHPVGAASAWTLRATLPLLVPLAIMMMGLSTGIAAWQYYKIADDLRPSHQARSELGKHTPRYKGEASDPETEVRLLRSGYADAEARLGTVALADGQEASAIAHYQRALELNTNSLISLNNLAWLRATAPDPSLRDGPEAVRLAERARQLSGTNQLAVIRTLSAAYAEVGRFDDAIAMGQKARAMALAQGQSELVTNSEELLELFKSHRPYHQEIRTAP